MKKLLTITLVLIMVLSFAACGNTTTSDVDNSTPTGTPTQTDSAQQGTTEDNQANTNENTTCTHSFSEATCTQAAKCTLCGATDGDALGHDYSLGKCTRCGDIDKNYATYKAGGKDSIIRTTADGKTTTLKIDISNANQRLQTASYYADSPSMDISYTKFLEVDGWLFFAQTINLKYSIKSIPYDVIVDNVFKIKIDGSSQTEITTYVETEDKAICISEVFGFDGGNIYYVLENENEGYFEIYSAKVSSELTNLTTQGKKVASSPTEYAAMWKCSLKDGYLYFSEKKSTYDVTVSASVTTLLDDYKIKLDGTGLTKLS